METVKSGCRFINHKQELSSKRKESITRFLCSQLLKKFYFGLNSIITPRLTEKKRKWRNWGQVEGNFLMLLRSFKIKKLFFLLREPISYV